MFARTALQLEPRAPEPRFESSTRLSRWPYLGLTGLVFIAFAVQGVNRGNLEPWQFKLVLVAWLLGLAAFCFAVLRGSHWSFPPARTILEGMRRHWLEIAGVALIGLIALAFRVYDLELHPYSFANDEGWVGLEGLLLLTGQHQNFFEVGWSSLGLDLWEHGFCGPAGERG